MRCPNGGITALISASARCVRKRTFVPSPFFDRQVSGYLRRTQCVDLTHLTPTPHCRTSGVLEGGLGFYAAPEGSPSSRCLLQVVQFAPGQRKPTTRGLRTPHCRPSRLLLGHSRPVPGPCQPTSRVRWFPEACRLGPPAGSHCSSPAASPVPVRA